MTGLPNRRSIEDTLTGLVSRTSRGAVLFLDVDRLKVVNDSLGHAAGDELLRAVADRLRELQQPGITVGRFGGDEFAIVLEPPADERRVEIAAHVLRRLRTPLRLGHRRLAITSSIGIASIEPGMTVNAVLRDADLAMYDAKAAGRDTLRECTTDLRDRAAKILDLEEALRSAIDRDGIETYFQPIVDATTGRPTAIEALARWCAPFGWVPPSEFIPVAEETGMIIPLGEQILIKACRAARQLERSCPGLTVAVNASTTQLRAGQMSKTVAAALDASGLDPARLELEVTEAVLMTSEPRVIEELATIRKLGASIAIDDFGTGYSSLAYLRRLPADTIKIDRAFVQDLHHPEGHAVLAAVATLAQHLGLHTIAEGVETPDQLDAVRSLGIAAAQGYLFGEPRPLAGTRQTLERLATDADLRGDPTASTPSSSVSAT